MNDRFGKPTHTHDLISKEKGIKYLELLKPLIKDENMFYIKSKIGGL